MMIKRGILSLPILLRRYLYQFSKWAWHAAHPVGKQGGTMWIKRRVCVSVLVPILVRGVSDVLPGLVQSKVGLGVVVMQWVDVHVQGLGGGSSGATQLVDEEDSEQDAGHLLKERRQLGKKYIEIFRYACRKLIVFFFLYNHIYAIFNYKIIEFGHNVRFRPT